MFFFFLELIVCLFLYLLFLVFVLGEEFWIVVIINILVFYYYGRFRWGCCDKLFCMDCNMYLYVLRLCRLIFVNILGFFYIKIFFWRFKYFENNYVRFLFMFWYLEFIIMFWNLVKKMFFCIFLCSKLGINVVLLNNVYLCYVSLWIIIIFVC